MNLLRRPAREIEVAEPLKFQRRSARRFNDRVFSGTDERLGK